MMMVGGERKKSPATFELELEAGRGLTRPRAAGYGNRRGKTCLTLLEVQHISRQCCCLSFQLPPFDIIEVALHSQSNSLALTH